jgi:hypothetical protein
LVEGVKYRWPLLCPGLLPTADPREFQAQRVAEIDRRLIERQLGGSRPQLELIALAVATMATVTTDRHVHGEATMTTGPGFVQGTTSVPLVAGSPARLEAEQVEHLLHRDLRAKLVEVDPRHDFVLSVAKSGKKGVPFPLFSIGGTGTASHGFSRCVANR